MAKTNTAVITEHKSGFVKGLGLTDATTLVMGSMIGSGIFIVSADVARQVKSPGLLIVCWLLGAILTIVGLPLWVDAVRCDPDRHHRRRRGRVCEIHRRFLSLDLRDELPGRRRS